MLCTQSASHGVHGVVPWGSLAGIIAQGKQPGKAHPDKIMYMFLENLRGMRARVCVHARVCSCTCFVLEQLMHAHTHTHTHTRTCTHTDAHTHARTHRRTHTHTCTDAQTHTHARTHANALTTHQTRYACIHLAMIHTLLHRYARPL